MTEAPLTRLNRRRVLALGLAAAPAVALASTLGTAQAAPQPTVSDNLLPPGMMEAFYVGTYPYQMYVERWVPITRTPQPNAMILVHGAWHSGVAWGKTPDGRDGWGRYFLRQGFTVYTVDLPGHGRSPMPSDYGSMTLAPAVSGLQDLLRLAGNSILMGHSMGGSIVARVVAFSPPDVKANLAGAVLVAPAAVGEILSPLQGTGILKATRPGLSFFDRGTVGAVFSNTKTFPQASFEEYFRSIVPESWGSVNEIGIDAPILGGPPAFAGTPTLVIAAENDAAVTNQPPEPIYFLRWNTVLGLPITFVGKDLGLPGHGHMMMIENGSDDVAAGILGKMRAQGMAV